LYFLQEKMAEIGLKTTIVEKIMTSLKISPFYYQHLDHDNRFI